ncbi:MAG TPA: carboxymuconolactone decarboxylase family protein [Thermodesulfobacteriota bacterium]|nr:carboxymuconolactone decarboxylase family protein [Thermodesulfobacteriota bacterium]
MADASEKKKKELLEKMEKERGYMLGPWKYLAERDVDFMEAYNNLYNRGLTDGQALPAKVREFIAIALLAYRGQEDAVYLHGKRALKLGATKQELLEAIETAMIPGGGPTLATGLRALARIEEEEKGK